MNVVVGDPVLPGDLVEDISKDDSTKVILGPGLRRYSDQVRVSKCGVLRKKEPNTYWVDNPQKRYVPARGELVVGVVVNKGGDIFKVDIGASEQASLSYLAFEGTTKKHRPNVQIGDVVYAQLLVASRDMEPELVCVDSLGKKGSMGVVSEGGFVFTCSLNLVRKILHPSCTLLKTLGKDIPYEIAVGMNGRIWIKGKTIKETIAIGSAILEAEHKSNDEISTMCNKTVNLLAGM